MGYGLYLYGILPAPVPREPRLQGLDQQPVHVHTIEDFVFLYSEAQQERYLASRRNLLDHERVLEQMMHAGYRTLLPLQFGLIIEDWETVATQLTIPHHDPLNHLLQKLAGHREVGVKIFWDPAAELQMLMEENQSLKAERDQLEGKNLSMDQVVRIGQSIEQAIQNRQDNIIQAFRTQLNPVAIEVVENAPLTETMIYNAAYLIPWDAEAEVSDRIDALDQQFGGRLRIRYNNFTAPFNFARLDQL
ncbi:protein gvpF/L [Leptolyngbya sp. 'hensonii']|uniref:gas vesicle protein GvpF n=1 Tax=Leptolyngbya sp. 'hensonii' TaxID=1922337 RepID=UPI00094F5D5C|nr:GvpL/GvpF family gas vesicle protein [Leptolyngbya sp. 'hensonii']OLP17609.1 protein gvpF/L [Leptolyngbya sp. 'hensonii']